MSKSLRSDTIRPIALTVLLIAGGLVIGAQSDLWADAQGWSGPGWYITSAASPARAQAYILFEGPHAVQSECVTTYDRFYSPIGICRFLDAKPAASSK
jgi:hypothetical protein